MDDEADIQLAPLSWHIDRDEGSMTVSFHGGVDENVNLDDLAEELAGEVTFDLRGVTFINSCGVREWVNLMRSLTRVRTLAFTHCSTAVVAQLNLVFNFRGNAEVRSVYVPYYCHACDSECSCLHEIEGKSLDQVLQSLPRLCDSCGAEMECDELPERYFAFLMVS